MDITRLIPEKYPYYLENFTRSNYSGVYKKYCSEAEYFFMELDAAPEACGNAAASLIEHITNLLPRRFGRKLKFFDLKQFLFLYIVPAAISHGSESSIEFVDAVQKCWNAKYPDDMLKAARFEEINGSFNDAFMGFQFRGSN